MKKIKALYFFVFLSNLSGLYSEWDPIYLPYTSSNDLESIYNARFSTLEGDVYQYVKNSWCSEEKLKLIMELIAITRPNVSVEIGAFTGSSTLPILAAMQYNGNGKTYVVEPWSTEEAVKGLPEEDTTTEWWKNLDMEEVQKHFYHLMHHCSLESTYEILQMSSQEAVELLPSIDFLHLDGNFSEDGALLDSQLYLPKVTPGGYILLSNVLVVVNGVTPKVKALYPIFDNCDIICELDHGNTLLFRKKTESAIEEEVEEDEYVLEQEATAPQEEEIVTEIVQDAPAPEEKECGFFCSVLKFFGL